MTQSYQQTSALSVAMFAAKSIRFYLLLIFVASPDISSSTRVNKTVSDGKVFITGDHNEVVMSSTRETKLELAKIKKKLKLLSESNEDLSNLLHAMNLRLTGLEKQGRISFLSWYRWDYWMPLHCIGLLLTTCKHYLLKKYITCALLIYQIFRI